jgi:hypothetical protein
VYKGILNSQLQSFQLKFTERLESRLSSKTIKVLLSNRKLTGRKRIAFDSNVHKITIFSDELENVKQLNYSSQKFSLSVNFSRNDCNWEFKISIYLKSGYLSFALESTLKKEHVIENVKDKINTTSSEIVFFS